MKLKNVKVGQRVQIKRLDEEGLIRYGHKRHTLHRGAVLECTTDGLDDDGHVRLAIEAAGEVWYYYTTHENLRKVK